MKIMWPHTCTHEASHVVATYYIICDYMYTVCTVCEDDKNFLPLKFLFSKKKEGDRTQKKKTAAAYLIK